MKNHKNYTLSNTQILAAMIQIAEEWLPVIIDIRITQNNNKQLHYLQ